MQRGKRKSPFIGSSEAPGSSGPILYYRYSSLADILVDGSAPLAPSQLASNIQQGVPAKTAKQEKAHQQPAPEPANGAEKPVKEKKQKEKAPKLRKLAPEERVSGPGNASEALKMREALGIVARTPEEIAEAEAAAQRAAQGSTFSFAFNLGGAAPAATAAAAAAAAPAARPVALATPQQQGTRDSSSESESESDSESDSEAEEEEGGAGAAAATAGGSASESEESEESSSESEEASSSDSDEEQPAAPQSSRPPPQQQQEAAQRPAAVSQQAAPAAAPAQAAAAGGDEEEEDGEYVPRRVYVGGMPFSYTEDKVHEYWSYCGEIEGMDMMTFPDTGRFRGIVFITFVDAEGYAAALACDGEQCDGQTLKVQKCKWSPKERAARQRARAAAAAAADPAGASPAAPSPAAAAPQQQQQWERPAARQPEQAQQTQRPQRQGAAPKTEGYDVAYVGNIAFEADEKELQRLFEGYNVTKIRLHTDKDTGRSKGFAHIHFKDGESLDRALALNGTSLHGRKIKMGYAQPKKE